VALGIDAEAQRKNRVETLVTVVRTQLAPVAP
jgi:hypothetical protein